MGHTPKFTRGKPRIIPKTNDQVDEPQVGFWLLKMVPRGPVVPARIYLGTGVDEEGDSMDRPLKLCGEVAGLPEDPVEIWHRKRTPTTEADFQYRTDIIRWHRQYGKSIPEMHPKRSVYYTDLPPIAGLVE